MRESRSRRSGWFLTALLPLLAVLIGCGDADRTGGGSDPEAQPAPGVTSFTEGDFDDLPLPPRSEPAGERTDRDGVATRSFFVRDTTPEEVLAFYRSVLDDASVIDRTTAIGPNSFRGRWRLGDRELLVTAGPAPGAETPPQDLVTQFNLELGPS